MNCQRYLDLISARLDGPLSPEDEAALTAHLSQCPECRAIADELANIHTTLTGAAAVPPAALAQGVMKSIRGQRTARKRTIRQLGALAACLVLCVGLYGLTRPEPAVDPAGVPDVARYVQPFALREELSFTNVRRIRLSAMSTSFAPTANLLDSADGLSAFLARFPYDDLSAVTQAYDEDYFRSHRLLAVALYEPSSSISHAVTSLTDDCVTILRDVPPAGDSDMALWLLLAEVDGTGPETPLAVELTES